MPMPVAPAAMLQSQSLYQLTFSRRKEKETKNRKLFNYKEKYKRTIVLPQQMRSRPWRAFHSLGTEGGEPKKLYLRNNRNPKTGREN